MAEESDVAKELAGLRKEVYDARSLIIRTDNLLKTFHSELKGISERQAQYERRHFVGHVAAYLIFGLLIGTGAYLYTREMVGAEQASTAASLSEARAKASKAEEIQKQADNELRAVEAKARQALSLHHKLNAGTPKERADGLSSYSKLRVQELDPFAREILGQEAERERVFAAGAALEQLQEAIKKGDFEQAEASVQLFRGYERGLPKSFPEESVSLVDYYEGMSLLKLSKASDAVEPLRRFVDSESPRATRAHASLLLGDALSSLDKNEDAKSAWRAGLKVGPSARLLPLLQSRLGIRSAQPAAAGTSAE